jgi:hypothetical protein
MQSVSNQRRGNPAGGISMPPRGPYQNASVEATGMSSGHPSQEMNEQMQRPKRLPLTHPNMNGMSDIQLQKEQESETSTGPQRLNAIAFSSATAVDLATTTVTAPAGIRCIANTAP